MKQYVFILAAIVAVSTARAQNDAVLESPASAATTSGTQAGGPIVIVNKYSGSQDTRQDSRQEARVESRQGTTAVQEQPLTVVESTPLRESRADQMRKARLSVESQTETKIVEKLESARIEDEKARQDRVLAVPFGSQQPAEREAAPHQQAAPQPQPAVVQQAQPQPVIVQQAPTTVQVVPVIVREEPRQEIRTQIREERDDVEQDEHRLFVSGNVGFADYVGKSNIQSATAYGFTVGTTMGEGLVLEGSFMYSNYTVGVNQPLVGYQVPPFVKLQQYNLMGAAKYMFLPGRFKPFAGVVASYAYRKYTNKDDYNYYYSYDASTNALDVGPTIGADFEVTRRFAIGADFRYLTNLMASNPNQGRSFYPVMPGNQIEKVDYYALQVIGKFTF